MFARRARISGATATPDHADRVGAPRGTRVALGFHKLMHTRSFVLLTVVALAASPSPARACSPFQDTGGLVLPPSGTRDVSTATSIVVLAAVEPAKVTVARNGTDVPLERPTRIGSAWRPAGFTSAWKLSLPDEMLAASSEYVVSGPSM